MKKATKIGSALIGLLTVFALTGCGGDGKEAGKEAQGGNGSGAPAGTVSQAGSEEKGYVFEYDGVTVSIDAPAAPIIESLGESASYYEAASCAFDGLDKMYSYNSVEIDTYPAEDGDRVSNIILKDDTVRTPEGVSLYMTKADMTAAYGENYTEEGGMLVYEKDGMKLRFIVENDEIVAIDYVSAVLN